MAAIIQKIRAGNKFEYLWAIERAGVAVDLTTATDIELSYGVGKPCADYSKIPFTVVDTNKISSSHLYGVTGTYNLKLEFKIDGEQSTIDIDAFKIVPRSEDASDSTQFAVTSDMAIGFKGDKLTFADLTPSDIAELQRPANDAIASIKAVEVSVEQAEALRVQAEIDRQTNTGTAIQNAETATQGANNAATNANTKAGLADTAANNANAKATLANDAAILANEKAGLANTAATNADNVANGYAAELAMKANHGYTGGDTIKTLKEVENAPFIPLQMPSFYVYDPSKFRVKSVKSTHKLKGNFTHIKKYNANTSAVSSNYFTVKTVDGKYSISFFNSGYMTRITVISNQVTIYDLSQASSIWWNNQAVIIQRTVVDFDKEKITVTYGSNTFEVSVIGLRSMKDIEFTDIELGINSYQSPCAYSVIIQGVPNSDIDGTKMFNNMNTPTTSNLVDALSTKFIISNVFYNYSNGKIIFDYATLSGLSTSGNSYTQHYYTSNRMFKISDIETNQDEIHVRYSFDVDVENASIYFKQPTTTFWKRIRLINKDTFAVTDITTNLGNPVEVPIGRWTIIISCIAKRYVDFGLLNAWGGCNNGAVMTIYQEHQINTVSVVLSAYPRYSSFTKAWCPYSRQFTSELIADFSNDII